MVRTGNLGLVKQINKYTILNIVRDNKFISRASIAKVASLNKATVSSLVDELISEDYIIESGIGASTGGRRPLMLKFNHKAGSLIGVELGVNYVYTILTDFDANILWEEKHTFDPKTHQDKVINQIITMIKKAMVNAPKTTYGVSGIGIGVPGIVNEQGTIIFAPNLHWDNVSIIPKLKEHFPDVQITVDNEAKLAALGEKWFGAGKEYNNLVYVSAGVGIGAGIIINGQLYSGVEGLAGEIGHMTIEVNGLMCSCGNIGCWEMYASEKAIKKMLQEANNKNGSTLPTTVEDVSVEQLVDMVWNNDEQIKQIFTDVGKYLGVGLINIINTYNPEAIIIGNSIGLAKDWVLKPAKELMKERVLSKTSHYPNISIANLGKKSCVVGATSSILNEILNPLEIK
jgi:glucokinase-like ROK family protein